MNEPIIVVHSDFDGYFERLVRSWIAEKKTDFKHAEIHVSAGPYRPAAVSYASGAGVLRLDFYSAIRVGFGGLSREDVAAIIEVL